MALVSVLLVNVLAIAPLVVAESGLGELLIHATYRDSHNFSSIELSCLYISSGLQPEGIGAIFLLNGTDIKEEIDGVEDINGTVHFVLTQKKEGFFTCNCSVNGSPSNNSIGLAAQPSTNYSGQSVTHEVELPDDNSTVSTELQCDIQPGALRQRYSVQWVQNFNSSDIVGNMFNLTLTVNSSTNGSLYQCCVTIDHNGSGLNSTYKGRLIVVITTEALQQGSTNEAIIAILSIFVPITLILLITCPILCCFFCIEAHIRRRRRRRHSFKRQSVRRRSFRRHSLRSSESYREVDVSSFDYQRLRDQGEEDHSGHNAPERQEIYQNQDSDQNHYCPTSLQEHTIHENLSLTPDPIPGVSVDQDRPTEMFKIAETNFEDIPQGEDFLTYSCETQILLPTSGPPIDPHNTKEYIPACFTPVATLSQCTYDGRWYYDEHNDFGLEIPPGAIPKKESITIDIGVALYGPFQYPEGLKPVSPVFWVCVRDQKDFQFSEPVKVTIPHCLDLKLCDDIESLDLSFLKGDHEMNSKQMYQFRQAEGDVIIEPLKINAVIKITHFCSLCFSCKDRRDLFEKEIFCLYSVIPCKISPDQPSDAYFFITLRLKTCFTTVQKQIKKLNLENHKEEKEKFQFSNVQELEMFLPQSSPAEWRVGMRGKKKILMREVDFFVKEFCETTKEELEVDEEEGMYPPKFHVVLSCSSSARESQTRIEFRGTTTDLVFDVFLTPAVTSPKPQVPDISSTRPAAPRTRGVSTSSSSSDKDGHALLASIGSGCSSTHEQVGPTPLGECKALNVGIDDLFDITTELCDVAKRWRYIGLALRLRNPDLNRITAEGRPVSDCLTDMLELWLNQNYDVIKYGEPSWQMLENAVRARAGGNNPALADQIHRKYIT